MSRDDLTISDLHSNGPAPAPAAPEAPVADPETAAEADPVPDGPESSDPAPAPVEQAETGRKRRK